MGSDPGGILISGWHGAGAPLPAHYMSPRSLEKLLGKLLGKLLEKLLGKLWESFPEASGKAFRQYSGKLLGKRLGKRLWKLLGKLRWGSIAGSFSRGASGEHPASRESSGQFPGKLLRTLRGKLPLPSPFPSRLRSSFVF